MALGRPATTSHRQSVPLPREVDDGDISPQRAMATRAPDTIASSSFFVHTLKLNQILNELLAEIYAHPDIYQVNRHDRDRHQGHEIIQTIARLDSKLRAFEIDLPRPFQWFTASSDALRPGDMQQLQRNLLGERLVYSRL